MIIRQAKKQNFSDIKKLIAMYPDKVMQTPLPPVRDFFIVIVKSRTIACCALEIYSKRLAEIRSLVVDKSFQRKGIGSKLVLACLNRAKKLKIYEVLSITSSLKLFKKLGFNTFNQEKYAMLKVTG